MLPLRTSTTGKQLDMWHVVEVTLFVCVWCVLFHISGWKYPEIRRRRAISSGAWPNVRSTFSPCGQDHECPCGQDHECPCGLYRRGSGVDTRIDTGITGNVQHSRGHVAPWTRRPPLYQKFVSLSTGIVGNIVGTRGNFLCGTAIRLL